MYITWCFFWLFFSSFSIRCGCFFFRFFFGYSFFHFVWFVFDCGKNIVDVWHFILYIHTPIQFIELLLVSCILSKYCSTHHCLSHHRRRCCCRFCWTRQFEFFIRRQLYNLSPNPTMMAVPKKRKTKTIQSQHLKSSSSSAAASSYTK